MENTATAIASTQRLGDAPMKMNPAAAPIMQQVRMVPQRGFIMSTTGPPPRLTSADPPWRMPNRRACCKLPNPIVAEISVSTKGKP